MKSNPLSRRNFLALSGAAVPALVGAQFARPGFAAELPPAAAAPKVIPVGLEMYSVRRTLGNGANFAAIRPTLESLSKMGYRVAEFWAPYYNWTYPQAKEVRRMLDDLGMRSLSTHNSVATVFAPGDGMAKAIELNQILGNKFIVMSSAPGNPRTVDDWQRVAATLTAAADAFRPHGLYSGYHNHQTEWTPLEEGWRAMDVLAANTPKDFMLQLDVGTCVEVNANPVSWITSNPGRINCLHLKDWSRAQGYGAIFGEGESPWKEILAAAESVGGVEYYLIEQEQTAPGADEVQTMERCMANWKKLRAA